MDELLPDVDYSNEALRKLGARIRNLRRRRGMTQRDLSFDGCSYSYLARIEAGERRPSPRVLQEIARRLGVSPDELAGELPTTGAARSLETVDAALMIRQGKFDDAEELLRGVLREAQVSADAPRLSEAYEGLGTIAARRGDAEAAMPLLEQAVELGDRPHPAQRTSLYLELARLYDESGDSARAIALLRDCLATLEKDEIDDPAKRVRFSLFLSQCYADAGDYGQASSVLAEALRHGAEEIDLRSRAFAYYALSRLYATTGHVSQSMAYADRALALYELIDDNRALSDAHLSLAQKMLDAARPEEATPHLTAARGLLGASATPVDLGFIEVEEARRALQAAEYDLARERARHAVELLRDTALHGQLGDAQLVLARVHDELGDRERADACYRAAVEAIRRQGGWNRELAKAYRWYGKFLKREGRSAEALEAFELAADLAPSNQDAMQPLAPAANGSAPMVPTP